MNVAEVKGFSEAEWSILDYFGTEVVRLALKLETISLAKERVWVIEEACKYVRDIEGFLNNREMNDPFTLSHYITNFSPNSLQTRVFIRVILSGISQIIFQEEKYHEETYKMLGSIADIYIPCLLTHQSMDSNVLQFILDLKTQLVIFGARCGEDLNHLIDSNFKTKKRSLTNLNGIKIESQLRKSHKRLLKSRRAEIFSVSSDMLVKRYPWREFVHNAHEFLHQMSQLIPNSVLFGRNNLSDHSTMELPPKTGRTTHLYESVNEGNKRLQLGRQSNPVLAIVKDEEAISNFINQDQPHFNEPIGSDQRLTKKRRRASDEHSSLGSIGGSCIASSSEVNSMQDRLFFRDSVFSNYSQVDDILESSFPYMDEIRSLSQTVSPRRGKMLWREEELDALSKGMRMFGTSWATILIHFGENGLINDALKSRSQIQLKDKARNEKNRRQKLCLPLDVFENACD